MARGPVYVPPARRQGKGPQKAEILTDDNEFPEELLQEKLQLCPSLRKSMEAAVKQLQSDTSQGLDRIWWEEGSCYITVPCGTPQEQRQWQERLQAAGQKGYDDSDPEEVPDAPEIEFASVYSSISKLQVALVQQFLGDLPSLPAKWGRVPADATWFDIMEADPVSCAWLGNVLISNWLLYLAIDGEDIVGPVIEEMCAIRRERVLAPMLVSTPGSQGPQEVPCQKSAALARRAAKAVGMQMMVYHPHIICQAATQEVADGKKSVTAGSRCVNMTVRAGPLPAARANTQPILGAPAAAAKAAIQGAQRHKQTARAVGKGLGTAAAMGMAVAEESIRLTAAPLDAIATKMLHCAAKDGPAEPAPTPSVRLWRRSVRFAYSAAGALSAIPVGLCQAAAALCT